MKKFLKMLNKTEKGEATNALMVFAVSLIVFMVIMVITISAFGNINAKWNIRQCARKYLLIAESKGCLTAEDLVNMQTELELYGLTNIVFDNVQLKDKSGSPIGTARSTTNSANYAEYGETIYIAFSGTLKNTIGAIVGSGNMFHTSLQDEEINIIQQTTSKSTR